MYEVEIMLFNNIDKVEFIDSEKLVKYLKVRYVTTDYELSGFDIYEDIYTGVFYATKL